MSHPQDPRRRPYTHPVYATQPTQQYPYPRTTPGTGGHKLPKRRRSLRVIAAAVGLALVALLAVAGIAVAVGNRTSSNGPAATTPNVPALDVAPPTIPASLLTQTPVRR